MRLFRLRGQGCSIPGLAHRHYFGDRWAFGGIAGYPLGVFDQRFEGSRVACSERSDHLDEMGSAVLRSRVVKGAGMKGGKGRQRETV